MPEISEQEIATAIIEMRNREVRAANERMADVFDRDATAVATYTHIAKNLAFGLRHVAAISEVEAASYAADELVEKLEAARIALNRTSVDYRNDAAEERHSVRVDS